MNLTDLQIPVVRCFLTALLFAYLETSSCEGQSIDVSGVLITVDERIEVPARTNGALVNLEVQEGSEVRINQPIATIDLDDARIQKIRAEVELDVASQEAKNDVKLRLMTKSLELATSELQRGQRSQALFAGSITDEELKSRQMIVDKAKLEVEQAEHDRKLASLREQISQSELENADRRLQLCKVVAPIAGVVVQVDRRQGEWVDTGQTILKIIGTATVRAEAHVDASLISKPLIGKPVVLVVEIGKQTHEFRGTLKYESFEINPVDGRVRVWAQIDNESRLLKPGMRGKMTIATEDE